MQTITPMIWTQVADSISYDDKRYALLIEVYL